MKMKYLALIFTAFVISCASAVLQIPEEVQGESETVKYRVIHVTLAATNLSSAGYSSRVDAGTEWNYFGRLKEGFIYKPKEAVLTVEGDHIHEAYLVVKDGIWVGFYLPVEKTYSPAQNNIKLTILEKEKSQ